MLETDKQDIAVDYGLLGSPRQSRILKEPHLGWLSLFLLNQGERGKECAPEIRQRTRIAIDLHIA